MRIVEITQPLKEHYDIELTNVYITDYGDQQELSNWCEENFGEYRLTYSKPSLNEPPMATVFIFENMEQAIMFKLRWA